jgi:hypothetical protein
MEKDFHYFLTYALAKTAGLAQSDIIAYACQFVDDNNEGQFRVDQEDVPFPERLAADGGYYYPIMTQSLSTKSLESYVQKYVYVPFHFLPGDNSVPIKGKRNPLNTTPNSPNGQKVLAAALRSKNPYRIGIALHTLADSWSHQNFTGLRQEWNAVYPWYNVFKSIVPNIGHAEAGHAPDIISETWTDYRFETEAQGKINNQTRALDAVSTLYDALRGRNNPRPEWADIQPDFQAIIGVRDYDQRIAAVSRYIKEKYQEDIPLYAKDNWIDQALDRTGDEVVMKPDFMKTHWFKFHQAAKAQFSLVMTLVGDIL